MKGNCMGRGFGVAAAVDDAVIHEIAREAEDRGYTSFWVNDTPGNDGLAALAIAAEVTSTIGLGVGVVPLDRRPAESVADDVERLGLPQERLYLGVGSGADPKGLTLVREGTERLHERLSAPVIVAALGPKMSALAGEVAEGVLFNWQIPSFARESGQWVIDAATGAGRPRPLLMTYVRTALLPQAEQRLVEEATRYASFPKYAAHFERMGVAARHTAVSSDDAESLQIGVAAYEQVMDETVVRAITADDSSDSILELLHACAPS